MNSYSVSNVHSNSDWKHLLKSFLKILYSCSIALHDLFHLYLKNVDFLSTLGTKKKKSNGAKSCKLDRWQATICRVWPKIDAAQIWVECAWALETISNCLNLWTQVFFFVKCFINTPYSLNISKLNLELITEFHNCRTVITSDECANFLDHFLIVACLMTSVMFITFNNCPTIFKPFKPFRNVSMGYSFISISH